MKPLKDDLPKGLHGPLTSHGLIYPTNLQEGILRVPIAASNLPLWDDPNEQIAGLPLMSNFNVATLDMDKEEDRREYQLIMDYHSGQYGMRIIHLERVLINKKYKVKRKDGKVTTKRRKVRRIYIEYFAPYKVIR
jgi:hypothetical protein